MSSFNSKNSLKRFFSSAAVEKTNKKKGRISNKEELSESEIEQEEKSADKDSKRSHERKQPDNDWFKIYPWLEQQVINDKITLFCTLCKERKGKTIFATGTTKYRLENLKNHIKTNEHKESEDLSKPQQLKLITTFSKQLGIDKLKIISLMRNVYFCSKNNQAINIFPELCKLVSIQIKNNKEYFASSKTSVLKQPEENNITKTQYGSYTNSNAGNEFLESICHVIEESLFNELNSSKFWSILIDESTTITDNKHLAIVSKYLVNNTPYMRYLGMLNLEETDASYIFNQIRLFALSKNLKFNSLIHFGSDGASTMTGHRSGVSTRLKQLNPFMSSNHCIAHRLHLAGKDASSKVVYFKNYEKILHRIYSYFSRSYKRQRMLHAMQDINDEPILEVLNLIETRWLSLSNVVGNLYKIIDSVLASLNEDSLEGENAAKNLIPLLDEEFVIATMFLADLTTILKRLIKVFQSDYVALSHLKPHLKAAIDSISEDFVGSANIQPKYGIILHNYMDQKRLKSDNLPSFIKDFAVAIIEALKERFPNSELYNALSIFDTKLLPKSEEQMTTYGLKEIGFLGEYYGDNKIVDNNVFPGIIDKKQLLVEWNSAKYYLRSFSERNYNFTEMWLHIFDVDDHFINNYPNVSLLVEIALIVPLSNANVERVFSQQNLIQTKLRNKLCVENLNHHLMILINGPDIEDFDFEKTYDYWINLKARRMAGNLE
ncbi:hypothetical protein RclHR1_03450002 [Rhizophagus clarus]|uniref:Zinc finger protein 862-like n=1 Tax=Rhizophagus clarus TaxID=94130 RepID=A0A2Z6R9Z9_9GLOM|nr:hypothetical protein RclHR1_03450002 [Rhizophagus clarus]GES74353.1 zinc finger protein 862-like [Rhizophagus clarus]